MFEGKKADIESITIDELAWLQSNSTDEFIRLLDEPELCAVSGGGGAVVDLAA